MVNIAGGGFLGVMAMVMSLLRTGGNGDYANLAICMALSSVALFIGGTIFYVASCCHAQAPEAEELKAEEFKAEKPKTAKPKAEKSK